MFSVWSNISPKVTLQGLEASLNKKLHLSFFLVLTVMSRSVETCLKQVLFQFRMERVRDLTKGFCQFCQSTSIHGLRYIGDKEKNVTSRITWLVILITSFMAAAYIISESVQGFNKIKQLFTVLIQSLYVVRQSKSKTKINEVYLVRSTVLLLNVMGHDRVFILFQKFIRTSFYKHISVIYYKTITKM